MEHPQDPGRHPFPSIFDTDIFKEFRLHTGCVSSHHSLLYIRGTLLETYNVSAPFVRSFSGVTGARVHFPHGKALVVSFGDEQTVSMGSDAADPRVLQLREASKGLRQNFSAASSLMVTYEPGEGKAHFQFLNENFGRISNF